MNRRQISRGGQGSASGLFLIVLIFLAACLAGGAAYAGAAKKRALRNSEAAAMETALRGAAGSLLDALKEGSPGCDGPFDPVWTLVSAPRADGIELSLEDVSSRLNPNLVSLDLLEKSDLQFWLASGSSGDLSALRASEGPASDISQYYDIFVPSRRGDIGLYSWANINVDEPSSLCSLYASLRSPSAGSSDIGAEASAFSFGLAAERAQKRVFSSEGAKNYLGGRALELWPALSASPFCNVNFASEELLEGILSYKPFGIADPRALAAALAASRASATIDMEELRRLCSAAGAPEEDQSGRSEGGSSNAGPGARGGLYQYLGVRTWFWRASAALAGRGGVRSSVYLIAAASPDAGRGSLKIIEAGVGR